jgi:hypothetical protein
MAAFLTIVVGTNSETVAQLNQLQADSSLKYLELNQLIDFLSRCAGGNEVLSSFYVVTNNSDPAVATDGGASAKITYSL